MIFSTSFSRSSRSQTNKQTNKEAKRREREREREKKKQNKTSEPAGVCGSADSLTRAPSSGRRTRAARTDCRVPCPYQHTRSCIALAAPCSHAEGQRVAFFLFFLLSLFFPLSVPSSSHAPLSLFASSSSTARRSSERAHSDTHRQREREREREREPSPGRKSAHALGRPRERGRVPEQRLSAAVVRASSEQRAGGTACLWRREARTREGEKGI